MRGALLILIMILGAMAEEDDGGPFREGGEPSGAAPAPAAAAVAKPIDSHKPWTDDLRAFCAEKQLALHEEGAGAVRLIGVGGPVAKSGEILRLAAQTLDGYEKWSGEQEAFRRKAPPPEEIYHLVIFAKDGDYYALVDRFRAKGLAKKPVGEDLTKKTSGFPAPRAMFAKGERIARLPEHWAIYATSCLAVDAFYRARSDKRAPTWIREGMAAEMQRIQLKTIRITTIAYEQNKEAAVDDWPREVARLITKGDQLVRSATDITRLGLDALAGGHYRQMWSLCTYIRGQCGSAKGEKNKFLQLLNATASGTASDVAIKDILGRSDPALTRAWHQWAVEFRP